MYAFFRFRQAKQALVAPQQSITANNGCYRIRSALERILHDSLFIGPLAGRDAPKDYFLKDFQASTFRCAFHRLLKSSILKYHPASRNLMLTVISPAKTLDFDTSPTTSKNSRPLFTSHTSALVDVMRKKSPKDLSKLMGISPKLAALNVERFQSFSPGSKTGKQALLAFKGDVYIGLEAENYGERDFNFAQKNLRILSGLYGVLRPLDMIQPYRLEMGVRLKTNNYKTLYEFWGDEIGESLGIELSKHRNKTLVNLASIEYFKSVASSKLPGKVITPVFKDYSKGTYKVLGFFAKKARGSMASFIVKNRISKPEDIKAFAEDGYEYNETYSTDDNWVFTRKAS